MADQNGNKAPERSARESELLPAMMAIALAVAAQLALNDGLTLLGVAGYVVATWLFVVSVRGLFDNAPGRPVEVGAPARPDVEAAAAQPAQPPDKLNRLSYLRHNWRLLTIAEIVRGDIPPARLGAQTPGPSLPLGPVAESDVAGAPGAAMARMESWTASESPESAPTAVKVTPQGDVLVLDTGLEQVQRFDEAGNLLATYSLAGLADLEVLDLAMSSDGRRLYIVDAASRRLQVITLANDDSAGEEE